LINDLAPTLETIAVKVNLVKVFTKKAGNHTAYSKSGAFPVLKKFGLQKQKTLKSKKIIDAL
jgi:hypothetical protein